MNGMPVGLFGPVEEAEPEPTPTPTASSAMPSQPSGSGSVRSSGARFGGSPPLPPGEQLLAVPGAGSVFHRDAAGRERQIYYHRDVDAAEVHADPNCRILDDRVGPMIFEAHPWHRVVRRGACWMCGDQPGRVWFHTQTPDSVLHRDDNCRGLRSRQRALSARASCAVCGGRRG